MRASRTISCDETRSPSCLASGAEEAAAMCFQNHRPPILQPANQIAASANASHATSSSACAMVSLKDDEAIANTNAEEIPTTQRGSYAKNDSIRARLNRRRTITSSTA